MSKVIEAIAAKMGEESAKEFRKAVEGMTLLDNSGGEYVNKGKAESELATAKKSLEDLTAKLEKLQTQAADGGQATAELEKKLKEAMDAHKTEVAALKKAATSDRITAKIKQELVQAGAKDADLAFTALGVDLDKIEEDASGGIIGLSDRIKAVQEGKTFLFDVKETKNTHLPTLPADTNLDAMVKGALGQIGYNTGA